MNAYDAYWFLYNHPKSVENDDRLPLTDDHKKMAIGKKNYTHWWEGNFIHNLDIMYVKVNPATNEIDNDLSLNTEIRVWLETGPANYDPYSQDYIGNVHDPRLDCGGSTFDEALVGLAELVRTYYGDYIPT